jgi:hypothetical protein
MKKFNEYIKEEVNESCEYIDECPSFEELESKVSDLNATLQNVLNELGGGDDSQSYLMEWLMDKIDMRIDI